MYVYLRKRKEQSVDHIKKKYDLEERLIEYAAEMIQASEAFPAIRAGNHIATQILRSGTSPASNYGEAMAAESRRDFLHKMGICLKELRETKIWLRIAAKRQMLSPADIGRWIEETDELIRIFKSSIRTANSRNAKPTAS